MPPTSRWFTPREWGPGWDRIDPALVLAVDDLRDALGRPVILLGDPTDPTGRVPGSQHPLGRAVDLTCPGVTLGDLWLEAERLRAFGGIGLYPWWRRPGLHVDTRPAARRARWWRDADGRDHPLTAATLAALTDRLTRPIGSTSPDGPGS